MWRPLRIGPTQPDPQQHPIGEHGDVLGTPLPLGHDLLVTCGDDGSAAAGAGCNHHTSLGLNEVDFYTVVANVDGTPTGASTVHNGPDGVTHTQSQSPGIPHKLWDGQVFQAGFRESEELAHGALRAAQKAAAGRIARPTKQNGFVTKPW